MIKHDNTALLEPLPVATQAPELRPAAVASVSAVPRQFDALDGFRFVAICAIIAHHSTGLLGFHPNASISQLGILVNYFFVLSGFVLAHQYPQIENAPQYLRYLGSRIARVVPVSVFTLLLMCMLNPMPIFDKAKVIPAFFANLFLVQTWFSDPNYYLCFNAPSWTLSVDMFLYLLLPATLVLAKRRWSLFFIAAALSFLAANVPSHFGNSDQVWSNFFFPPLRIFDFALGVLAYRFAQEREFRLSLVVTVLLEIYLGCSTALLLAPVGMEQNSPVEKAINLPFYNGCSNTQLVFQFIPTIDFALLILVLTSGKGVLAKLYSCKPLVLLGKISCSLYLLHFPIIVYLRILSAGYKPVFSPLLLGSVAIFLIIAALSLYLVFEDPARKLINQQLDRYFALNFPGQTPKRWHQRKVEAVESGGKKGLGKPALIVASLLASLALWSSIASTIKADFAKAPNPQAASISELDANGSFANSLDTPKNIYFDNAYTLKKIKFDAPAGKTVLRTLWQATAKANNSTLAVHLLNEKGEIVRQYDHILLQKAPQGSLLWVDSVDIENTALNGIKTIGLAIVVNKESLPFTSSEKVNSDWGAHRLLINWPITSSTTSPTTSSSSALAGDTHQEK